MSPPGSRHAIEWHSQRDQNALLTDECPGLLSGSLKIRLIDRDNRYRRPNDRSGEPSSSATSPDDLFPYLQRRVLQQLRSIAQSSFQLRAAAIRSELRHRRLSSLDPSGEMLMRQQVHVDAPVAYMWGIGEWVHNPIMIYKANIST
jgi:hypothetical protein